MLFSIAIILLAGLLMGNLCRKIKIPGLFGMIIAGIVLGPYALNLIDSSVLDISAEIRKIALVIILIRAGLKLSVADLKKVGRPAVLMCFVPAVFEIAGMVIFAPLLFGLSYIDALVMGSVVAAVSPAVVVPKMIDLIDEKRGTGKSIPQMILAGASVDDVFVIVLFTTFTGLSGGKSVSFTDFLEVPASIITGIAAGLLAGILLCIIFRFVRMNDIVKALIVFSVALLLTAFEDRVKWFPFASLIGVMAMGLMIRRKKEDTAVNLSRLFDKVWVFAEIFLFVLVGASVAIDSALSAGLASVALILCVLVFRMAGVMVCLIGTGINIREKIFCMFAYTPKATVQAAIGGLPLAMGLSCGSLVLTVSVVAILITAPLGAFAIDFFKKFLKKEMD